MDCSGQAADGPRQDFPRASRLLRRADFEAVYGAGHRRSSPHFTLSFRSQDALATSRPRQEFAAGRQWREFETSRSQRGSETSGANAGTRGAGPGARSRFGISVKKAVGGAVVRNRIRRRIREILRRNQTEIPTGWDIVIHPRRSVAEAPFAPLEAELVRLLRSLGPSDTPPAS